MKVKPIADDDSSPSNDGLNKWVESEIGASHFADERLAKRFGTLLGMLTRRVGTWVYLVWSDGSGSTSFTASGLLGACPT